VICAAIAYKRRPYVGVVFDGETRPVCIVVQNKTLNQKPPAMTAEEFGNSSAALYPDQDDQEDR
jgi:hypothetical protein